MWITNLSLVLYRDMCGSLNIIDPHTLIGTDTVRRYGFVGVGMVFVEEMYQGGDGF